MSPHTTHNALARVKDDAIVVDDAWTAKDEAIKLLLKPDCGTTAPSSSSPPTRRRWPCSTLPAMCRVRLLSRGPDRRLSELGACLTYTISAALRIETHIRQQSEQPQTRAGWNVICVHDALAYITMFVSVV